MDRTITFKNKIEIEFYWQEENLMANKPKVGAKKTFNGRLTVAVPTLIGDKLLNNLDQKKYKIGRDPVIKTPLKVWEVATYMYEEVRKTLGEEGKIEIEIEESPGNSVIYSQV